MGLRHTSLATLLVGQCLASVFLMIVPFSSTLDFLNKILKASGKIFSKDALYIQSLEFNKAD